MRHPIPAPLPLLFAASVWLPAAALAQTTLPTVNVSGSTTLPLTRVTDDVAASPASVTVLGRRELDQKTINTYGDVFRGVTGVAIAEYGQGLVAYELKFRGFTSGHGRDVAAFLDGVPLNVTGSQHTNGYMDLAQLIPELLDRVEIVRGPFSAYAGNHAIAGSVQMFTERNVASSIKASVDNFGRVRVLPVYSTAAGPGQLLVALDATQGSSYTKQSDVERANLFTRYVMPLGPGALGLRFQSYHADADAPGYLDLARIESGQINRRDALAKGIGDRKHQNNVVLNYRSDDAEGASGAGSGWTGSLYAVRDQRERFTNYDLALPSFSVAPLGGERDRLQQTGFDLRKVTMLDAKALPAQLSVGVQYNRERVIALHFVADAQRNAVPPSAAQPNTVDVDRTVLTTTQAVYGQLQLQPMPALKLTLGARYDKLDFDVALRPQDDTYAPALASGVGAAIRTSAGRFSPKLGAAFQVFDNGASTVELYGNAARGIKSPYAFSDFYANVAAGSSTVPDLTLSTLRSVEFGVAGSARDGSLRWRAGLWDTRQDKEAGPNDAGLLASFGRTSRKGFDLEASAQVGAATRVFGNYSGVRARSLTAPAGADRLTNVPEWTAAFGIASVVNAGPSRWELSLEDSVNGPQSLTADNALRGSTYHRVSARAGYSHAAVKGASGYVSLVAYDKQFEEPRFDFGGGVVGVSPRPRLQVSVGAQYNF